MAQPFAQDRLIRKEVALGYIRELAFPDNHIGLSQLAPFLDVQSDDVIFQYVQDIGVGMAPARAEDAEAEMAYKEETFGQGRASIIDWSIKDHYAPSDVDRYRESIYLAGQLGGGNSLNLPLTVSSITEGFEQKLARDTAIRKRKIDNRIEWLIMQALWNNVITYNDGKVVSTVTYNRPVGQQGPSVTPWNTSSADPINDIMAVQEFMLKTHNITVTKAITSRQVMRNILTSDKFAARAGFTGATGGKPVDPRYLIDGWGYEAAAAVIERATGVSFQIYDSFIRTRTKGSTTLTNHRLSPHDSILFLPSDAEVSSFAVDEIGFGKVLTSPHPEGNWTSGYYEWEKNTGPDPWGYDVGIGIKAWPVFPHLDLTYVMKVLSV